MAKLTDFTTLDNIVELHHDDHPSTYRFKTPVPIKEHPGYFLIPGFINYGISRDGRIINHITNSDVATHEMRESRYNPKHGYYIACKLYKNSCEFSRKVHRLLMLTFTEYDFHPATMTVNHIDGCKSNLTLTNLEWITLSGNAKHAVRTGLNNSPILGRTPTDAWNIRTNEKVSFDSIIEAAEYCDLTGQTVSGRIKYRRMKPFPDGWVFKRREEEWGKLDEHLSRSHNREVERYDIHNGEVNIYPSLKIAGDSIGKSGDYIQGHCRKRGLIPCNGRYIFRYSDDLTAIPEYSNLQKRWFLSGKQVNSKEAGCLLIDKDGSEMYFGSLAGGATLLGLSMGGLYAILKREKNTVGFYIPAQAYILDE
jgi:hypothetical protein